MPAMKRALYIALAILSAALAVVVGAFLLGVEVDGDFLRAPLERVLTAAFDVPTTIEGPLRLRTGRAATISADALVLADPSGPAGVTLARGVAPRARIDLLRLLRGEVSLDEVGGDRLELALRRQVDGRGNWAQLFSSTDKSSRVSFTGMARLRIDAIVGSYQRASEPAVPFAIHAFDGAVPLNDALRASGTAEIVGQRIGFDLHTASLAALKSAAARPVQGKLAWAGAQATLDGKLLDRGERLEATVNAVTADATAPLAAIGITAKDLGPLVLRGHFTAAAQQVSATELVASIGRSEAAGSVSYAWGGPKPRIAIDLTGKRVDATPFLAATPGSKATRVADEWVAGLEHLATATEASVQLAIDELDGLPVAAKDARLHLRSGERALAAKAAVLVAGSPVNATLDYDARKPQHTLAIRIDSGAASTASLPDQARPRGLAVATSGVRGELRGEGASVAALVASLQGSVDARNLDWKLGRDKAQPVSGRFDVVRVDLQGAKAASAEVSGKIEGAPCALKVVGGSVATLLAGEPWPVQFSAACPNERINAKGRIALAEPHATADLSFDLVGDHSGPVARAVGLPPSLPYPLVARGTLLLDDGIRAQLRLAAVRLGRTAGSGEIDYPLAPRGTTRLRLALATLNLDEFGAARGPDIRSSKPPERRLLPANLRLPDVDYEVAADRIEYNHARLRDFLLTGSVRGRRMQAAPFRISWDGLPLRGKIGLDFSGTTPRLQVDGAAQDGDLRPLLAALGVEGVRLRAENLSVSARAQGETLHELLASATLNATVDGAQIQVQRPLLPGSTGRGTLAATLKAAPGTPSKLTARGEFDSRPIDLAVDGPAIDVLASAGSAQPLAVRATFGDVRLQAEGSLAGDGRGEGHLRVAGGRLDKLGDVLGIALPEVQPYAASADVTLSPGVIEFSDLDTTFGSSRVSGRLRVDRREGRRPAYSAALRAPVLHLEDIGTAEWSGVDAAADGRSPDGVPARRTQSAIDSLLELLRVVDVDASIDIDALYGGTQQFGSGRVQASAAKGGLRLALSDVHTQDGTADAVLLVDAGASPPRFAIRANGRGVEYGALLRALNPASTLNGHADFVIDLATQGERGNLLQALQGTVSVATYPRGMKSDALGIWGSGLLPVILRQVDRDSQAAIECSVSGFTVAGGVARSDGFFVETTHVRIIGELEIRLPGWDIAGRIDPRSNQPQLFTISPTMLVRGTLGYPSLSVAPENLVLAPLRFASSPLTRFASDWVGRRERHAEGKVECREAFEQMLQARSDAAGER